MHSGTEASGHHQLNCLCRHKLKDSKSETESLSWFGVRFLGLRVACMHSRSATTTAALCKHLCKMCCETRTDDKVSQGSNLQTANLFCDDTHSMHKAVTYTGCAMVSILQLCSCSLKRQGGGGGVAGGVWPQGIASCWTISMSVYCPFVNRAATSWCEFSLV